MKKIFPFLSLMLIACSLMQAQRGKPAFLVYLVSFDTAATTAEFQEFEPVNVHQNQDGTFEYYAGAYGDEALADSVAQKAKDFGFLNAKVMSYAEFYAKKGDTEESSAFSNDNPLVRLGLPNVAGGRAVSVSNLFFGFDSARLSEESRKELNRLSALLRQDTSYVLEVRAHCDALGEELYNIHLSERRRDIVVNYLIRHGVPDVRIEPHIFGEANPIAGNEDRESRKYNRRVELVIIETN